MPGQIENVAALLSATPLPQKLQSFAGLILSMKFDAKAALEVQLFVALALFAAVAWVWRQRSVDNDLKAAFLVASMTLASPYQFVYDLVLLTLAQAFFLRAASRDGSLRLDEIAILTGANLLVFEFAAIWLPLGIFGSIIVFALVARRTAVAVRRNSQHATPDNAAPPRSLAASLGTV